MHSKRFCAGKNVAKSAESGSGRTAPGQGKLPQTSHESIIDELEEDHLVEVFLEGNEEEEGSSYQYGSADDVEQIFDFRLGELPDEVVVYDKDGLILDPDDEEHELLEKDPGSSYFHLVVPPGGTVLLQPKTIRSEEGWIAEWTIQLDVEWTLTGKDGGFPLYARALAGPVFRSRSPAKDRALSSCVFYRLSPISADAENEANDEDSADGVPTVPSAKKTTPIYRAVDETVVCYVS